MTMQQFCWHWLRRSLRSRWVRLTLVACSRLNHCRSMRGPPYRTRRAWCWVFGGGQLVSWWLWLQLRTPWIPWRFRFVPKHLEWLFTFWILVEILRAWKNEIYDGSIPVGPGGMVTSTGETAPTLAAVWTLLASMMGFKSNTGSLEKMKPTLLSIWFLRISSSGIAFPNFDNSS